MIKYILRFSTGRDYFGSRIGRPVGLDSASGGYPYAPSDFAGIKLWDNAEDALEYARMCPHEIHQRVFTVTITMEEL